MTRSQQRELRHRDAWGNLVAACAAGWSDLIAARSYEALNWHMLAVRGGFPVPAVQLKTARRLWLEGYVRTYLERDLQQLSSIAGLPDFRCLMPAVSLHLG